MPRIRAGSIAEHKVQTRAAILEAASRLFYDPGYADTTLSAIADDAGIGRSTLYQYFADKEQILVDVVAERVPAHVDALLEELPADLAPVEWFELLFERALRRATEHLPIVKVVLRDAERLPPESQERLVEATGRFREAIHEKIAATAKPGSVAAADPGRTGEFVALLLRNALVEMLVAGDDPGADGRVGSAAVPDGWRPLLRGALGSQLEET